MFKFTKPKAGIAALGAVGLCLGAVSPAVADIAPGANDVVGAGSDTTQYAANFLFDGIGVNTGYNLGLKNRAFSFDATADASGRTVYSDNSASGTILAATAVMRAGSVPVVRPLGSGAGIASLYKGVYPAAVGGPVVQFARASRLPSCTENSDAAAAGFGGLHVYKFAKEDLAMGVVKGGTSNAPAGLTPDQVLKIYTGVYSKWNDIPGNGAGSGATIIPMVPPLTSGTRATFDADMKTANGGSAPTYSNPNLQTTTENDYTAFANSGSPANAIIAFSGGRIGLNDSGYFGAAAQNQVKQLLGTPPGGGSSYDNQRNLYFVAKQSDVTSSVKFQPGGTQNWVQALFGSSGVLNDPGYAANITAAGFTPAYSDLGLGVPGTSCT